MSPEPQALCILLVEDSLADIRLTEEALRDSPIVDTLHVARDGEEAMDFLHGRGAHSDAPRPDLVLLDLNLPRKDGREVLEELKGDSELRRIPIVVLNTSATEADILRSYDLHVNSYVTKPVDLDEFAHVVHSIQGFWGGVVQLPPS
ncbi:MAG: response regulator [Solirubrobacteraceae bacterium]